MTLEPMPGGSPPDAPAPGGQEAGANRPVSRIIQWLNRRIEKLERELDELYELRTLLEQLELAPWPGEKVVKDITVADRRIAMIVKGVDHVRAVFDTPQQMPQEVQEYLRAVEEKLKARDSESLARATEKVNALQKPLQEKVRELEKQLEEELPALEIVDGPGGAVFEVRFDNVKPDNESLQEALELAIKASYLLLRKNKDRDHIVEDVEFFLDGDSNGRE